MNRVEYTRQPSVTLMAARAVADERKFPLLIQYLDGSTDPVVVNNSLEIKQGVPFYVVRTNFGDKQ